MENSTEETEAHQSFKSPPRRRRSTFFERRESVIPQYPSEIDADDVHIKNTEKDKRFNEMSRYYEKLLTEKNQWKSEVNERRHKYHDLRQQYKMAQKAPSTSKMSCYSALTNEDIEYLQAKPHISTLVDNQQNFHKSVQETIALVKRVNELEEIALQICEDRVNKITAHILENSTVDTAE